MDIKEELKKAVEYTKNKKIKDAKKIYKILLEEAPDNVAVLSFAGVFYYNLNNYKKASIYLEKAYELSQSKTILKQLGLAKLYIEDYYAAAEYLKKYLVYDKSQEIYENLINACRDINSQEAYKYALEEQKLYPTAENTLLNLALTSLSVGKFKESEKYTNILLKLYPDNITGINHYGLLLELLYCDEEKAREYYKKLVKMGYKETGYYNLAVSYSKTPGTREQYIYYLNKLKKINPNAEGLNLLFAVLYLSNRQFQVGGKYYIKYFECHTKESARWFKTFKNEWQGEKQPDKTLFVYGDQGLGDQIQFSRYLPFVSDKFKKVKVAVSPKLLDLFKKTFKEYKNIKFLSNKDKKPRYDCFSMMSGLFYHLKMNVKDIPYSNKYLIADDNLVKEYKEKYFNKNGLNIGICWESGSASLRGFIHRTLNVELFENIINKQDANIYSMQVKSTLNSYKKYHDLIDLGQHLKSFSDTAAALKNLDILVTVDTSLPHLAGALGVKTFLILPYCSDWRWFDNTEKTEWYNSVKIFKQCYKEDWSSVFKRIETELNNSV